MSDYFDNVESCAKLKQVAESWAGTPFIPNAEIKRAGVSCQKLAGAIYKEVGFLPNDFNAPEGEMNWSMAQKESLIAKFMDSHPAFQSQENVFAWKAGDMVGFEIGGCVHHCGVVIDGNGKFIHCLRGQGTIINSLRDASFFKRIKKLWRPKL